MDKEIIQVIELREITRDNFHEVIKLSVHDEQKAYVATNIYSMAEAKVKPECVPLAIYNQNVPVGFIMYCIDADDNEYWIFRLMIDKTHQGKGYGYEAMMAVLSIMQLETAYDKVYISFEPENATAKKLYERIGFVPDGRIIDGEIVYCLRIQR